MAHIQPHRNKWRVQVEKLGVRRSRVCDTIEEAHAWAASAELLIRKRERAKAICRGDVKAESLLITAIPKKVLSALSSIPYDGETIIDASIPCGSMTGLYFLIVGSDIKYVGQSIDVLGRISRHMRDGKVFDSFSFISSPKETLDALEETYISALLPDWNVSLSSRQFS
jgi:hypothetical protein